jgi:hypothetical protein
VFTMAHWQQLVELIKRGRLPVLAWFIDGGVDTFRFAHLTFQVLDYDHCTRICSLYSHY